MFSSDDWKTVCTKKTEKIETQEYLMQMMRFGDNRMQD